MWRLVDVKMWRLADVRMGKCEDVKMGRCEDSKMLIASLRICGKTQRGTILLEWLPFHWSWQPWRPGSARLLLLLPTLPTSIGYGLHEPAYFCCCNLRCELQRWPSCYGGSMGVFPFSAWIWNLVWSRRRATWFLVPATGLDFLSISAFVPPPHPGSAIPLREKAERMCCAWPAFYPLPDEPNLRSAAGRSQAFHGFIMHNKWTGLINKCW